MKFKKLNGSTQWMEIEFNSISGLVSKYTNQSSIKQHGNSLARHIAHQTPKTVNTQLDNNFICEFKTRLVISWFPYRTSFEFCATSVAYMYT